VTTPPTAAPPPLAESSPPSSGRPPTRPAPTLSIDHWLPLLAVLAMIGTFLALPAQLAITVIGAIWLAWTRVLRRPNLLGLTLTEALAWAATLTIAELVAVIVLFALGGVVGGAR
jgi:hypothetical protein